MVKNFKNLLVITHGLFLIMLSFSFSSQAMDEKQIVPYSPQIPITKSSKYKGGWVEVKIEDCVEVFTVHNNKIINTYYCFHENTEEGELSHPENKVIFPEQDAIWKDVNSEYQQQIGLTATKQKFETPKQEAEAALFDKVKKHRDFIRKKETIDNYTYRFKDTKEFGEQYLNHLSKEQAEDIFKFKVN